MEQKLDMEHRMTVVEARSADNALRLDDLERRQDNLDSLASSVSVLAAREERVESDVKEIKADVKLLAGKPGKRMETLEEKILLTIAAAVIGFLLAQVGL